MKNASQVIANIKAAKTKATKAKWMNYAEMNLPYQEKQKVLNFCFEQTKKFNEEQENRQYDTRANKRNTKQK